MLKNLFLFCSLLLMISCSKELPVYYLNESGAINTTTNDTTYAYQLGVHPHTYSLQIEGRKYTFFKNTIPAQEVIELDEQLTFRTPQGEFGNINMSETFQIIQVDNTISLEKSSNIFKFYLKLSK